MRNPNESGRSFPSLAICATAVLGLVLFSCSRARVDPQYERAVREKGFQELRSRDVASIELPIGALFGTKAAAFCISSTVPDTQRMRSASRAEFFGAIDAVRQYADENQGDLSSESSRLFFVDDERVVWSVEIHHGSDNLRFSGSYGCFRLTDTVQVENADPVARYLQPAGPLSITFVTAETSL